MDHTKTFDQAQVYQLTSRAANPIFASDVTIANPAFFTYTMPAYSVSTLNLVDAPEPGNGLILTVALLTAVLLLGPHILRRRQSAEM